MLSGFLIEIDFYEIRVELAKVLILEYCVKFLPSKLGDESYDRFSIKAAVLS